MKVPQNKKYIMFGGVFVLANKLQITADKRVSGLSAKQWFLLRNLSDLPQTPPPSISLLAKEADTTRQNASKMLDAMQKQGYVQLCGNEADRRSQCVNITQKGEQALRQMASNAEPFFKELFANIPEPELNAAAEVVIKLINNLNIMQGEER